MSSYNQDPEWYYATMMAILVVVEVTSLISCSLTFLSFYLFSASLPKHAHFELQKKLIIWLQVNDFVWSLTFLWRGIARGGDYNCDSVCQAAGFFSLASAMNHWAIITYICGIVKWKVMYNKTPSLQLRYLIPVTSLVTFVVGILPLCGIPTFQYQSYGWWVVLGRQIPVLSFCLLVVPVSVVMALTVAGYIIISRKVANISADAPPNSGPEYKTQAVHRLLWFPLAFLIAWLPAAIWHSLYFFGAMQLHSTTSNGFAIVVLITAGLSGFINAMVYMQSHKIFQKFKAWALLPKTRTITPQELDTQTPQTQDSYL